MVTPYYTPVLPGSRILATPQVGVKCFSSEKEYSLREIANIPLPQARLKQFFLAWRSSAPACHCQGWLSPSLPVPQVFLTRNDLAATKDSALKLCVVFSCYSPLSVQPVTAQSSLRPHAMQSTASFPRLPGASRRATAATAETPVQDVTRVYVKQAAGSHAYGFLRAVQSDAQHALALAHTVLSRCATARCSPRCQSMRGR